MTHGTLWLLPGVGHVGAFQAAPTEYIARVSGFIDAAEVPEVQR
jgi:hypothetical protein